MSKSMKMTICLDFDGVCHAYTSPFVAETITPDPPVPGLFDFLERVTPHFRVAIYSTRSRTAEGRAAMIAWFRKHAPPGGIDHLRLEFPFSKPLAVITIDDRALTFDGTWPTVTELQEFKPWNRK